MLPRGSSTIACIGCLQLMAFDNTSSRVYNLDLAPIGRLLRTALAGSPTKSWRHYSHGGTIRRARRSLVSGWQPGSQSRIISPPEAVPGGIRLVLALQPARLQPEFSQEETR